MPIGDPNPDFHAGPESGPNRNSGARPGWQQQLREAAAQAEGDLRKVVTYINDQAVPDLRRNGIEALRVAAAELHKLAERLDPHAEDRRRSTTAPQTTPPPPPPRDEPQP